MQKITQKASILLWAIFLSLLIGAIFISISTQIYQNIENNNIYQAEFSETIEKKNELTARKNKLSETKATSFEKEENIKKLKNGDIMVFQDRRITTLGLKKNETASIAVPQNTNITLDMQHGLIQYTYKENNKDIHTQKMLESSTTFTAIAGSSIILKNFSGYSRVRITSEAPLGIPEQHYKVYKSVGGTLLEKESGTIQR